MRLIGLAERALEKMCRRTASSQRLSASLSANCTVTLERIAELRILIDQTRLLVLNSADRMDKVGNKVARARHRDDQGRRAEHGLQGHRLGDPGPSAAAASRPTSAWPTPTPTHARCASRTGPTRCIATRSAGSNCAATRTDHGDCRYDATHGRDCCPCHGQPAGCLPHACCARADQRLYSD